MWSCSHKPMSSRTVVVILTFVSAMMMMMTSVVATPSTIKHCLRLKLNPPSPPPAGSEFRSALGLSRIVCRDAFRAISHYLHSAGKLPLGYLRALCDIFGDNEKEVERYVTRTFRPYDFRALIAGRSCATIRKRQHAKPPETIDHRI